MKAMFATLENSVRDLLIAFANGELLLSFDRKRALYRRTFFDNPENLLSRENVTLSFFVRRPIC